MLDSTAEIWVWPGGLVKIKSRFILFFLPHLWVCGVTSLSAANLPIHEA